MSGFQDSTAGRSRIGREMSSVAEVPGNNYPVLPGDPPYEAMQAAKTQSMQPIIVALLRGAALAFVVAAVDFFTSLQLDYSVRDCFVSAALLFFVTLQSRGILEGAFDQFRATRL